MSRGRGADALIGLVYIVLICVLIAVSIMIYNKDFVSTTDVHLHTNSSGATLTDGADVMVRGVLVGDVSDITTNGNGAEIDLELNPGKADKLPQNMSAQLLPETLFGRRYVNLVFPADPSSSHLHDGSRISQDTSARSIELQKLFDDLLPVLQTVQPEKLNSILGELALALRGQGTPLADALDTTGAYLKQLAPHIPQLTNDFKTLAAVARDYTSAGPDLITGLDSLITTSRTFASQRSDFQALLTSFGSFADSARKLVEPSSQDIITVAGNSLPPLTTLKKYAAQFPCISRALVGALPRIDKAFGAGTNQPGAHAVLHIVPVSKKYTSADLPTFGSGGPPLCPGVNGGTTPAPSTGTSSADATAVTRSALTGLGAANSPSENALIASMVAPTVGMRAADYPQWASLLLGPALRGMEVSRS